jgi:hypothetical protein
MKLDRRWIVGALLLGLAVGCSRCPSSPTNVAAPPPKAGDQKAPATRTGPENPPP